MYEGKKLIERQPRVAFSTNGLEWSAPSKILSKGDWLWRLTWHESNAYGICYYNEPARTNETSARGSKIRLVKTSNGLSYDTVAGLDVSGSPNESTLRFQDNGDCVALVRREAADKEAWIGTSAAPYKKWQWHAAGMQVGGPNFLILPGHTMIAGGRKYPSEEDRVTRTFVGPMTLNSVKPALLLPSGGDCSYPGMLWRDGKLWLSYYSSHEGSTDIYFAILTPSPRS